MLHKPYKTITQDNGTIKIYGNNHSRAFLYFYELTDKEKRELDYIEDDTELVIRYKGNVIALCDFVNTHNEFYNPGQPTWMKEFDGYINDSFFSGLLIKLDPNDNEYYKIYTFIG